MILEIVVEDIVVYVELVGVMFVIVGFEFGFVVGVVDVFDEVGIYIFGL